MKKILMVVFLFSTSHLAAQNIYYVAPTGGDDNYEGTIDAPWATWRKAFDTAQAGDTVYFRGGVWYPEAFVTYDGNVSGNSGTSSNPISYFNYPGETPILDCSRYPYTGDMTALDIRNVGHVKFRGLTIRNLKQNSAGQWVSGLQFYECGVLHLDRMMSHGHGGYGIWFKGYDALHMTNCDSYDNVDDIAFDPGNRADGFQVSSGAIPMDKTKTTYLSGCRAWDNSDDGFEISAFESVEISDCWSWSNGRLEYGMGMAFKFASSYMEITSTRKTHHTLSVLNKGVGYVEQNLLEPYYGPIMEHSNNTTYDCEWGFGSSPGTFDCGTGYAKVIYRNNSVYDSRHALLGQAYLAACNYTFPVYAEGSHNTWIFDESVDLPWFVINPAFTVTDDDFVSVDRVTIVSQLSAPRKADGTLPDITVFKLTSTSDLIDAGTDVGLPYSGAAPDIGCAEYTQPY
jgi:hypothetical protein